MSPTSLEVSLPAHSSEDHREPMTVPPIEPPSLPTVPTPVHPLLNNAFNVASYIFLDICSGSTRPLSQAILNLDGDVLSFDILLHDLMDLLADESFEHLLRICSSGKVRYAGASPACAHYSRLKPGGPRALRTPDQLDGVPGLTPSETLQLQESYLMLSRVITCLTLVFQAGGHVHLEQPPTAMSWQEPCVQQFLTIISAFCVHLPACHFDRNWHKSWMFATSYEPLSVLGNVCEHAPFSHQQIAGVRTDSGEYLSRQTACYPPDLSNRFAQIIMPLLSKNHLDWQWQDTAKLLPIKSPSEPPFGQEDGAGLSSQPDWSTDPRTAQDHLHDLRTSWMKKIVNLRFDQIIQQYFAGDHSAPPFSAEQLAPFRVDLEQFLQSLGHNPDWQVREHQPMHLHILRSLSQVLQDRDTSLFDCLIRGVSTGFRHDIPVSNCFPPNDRPSPPETPLSAHLSNWHSAEEDPALTQELIDKEVQEGWAFPFDGSLEEAQDRWPVGVSIGKLGIAHSEGRSPRLVLDNSICGLNSRCHIPERSTLPSIKDVVRSYPIRQVDDSHLGFSLDVKAAHKRIVLLEEEQGLVGFSFQQRLYFYRVAPFGATFSASWWSRLGGFLLRLIHFLVWVSHVGLLYVDDFLFYQSRFAMPLSAAMICILAQITGIPISWAKCELGPTIHWIGWRIHLSSGFIEIPLSKIEKMLRYIKTLLSNSRTSKSNLEKLIGLTMWITQLFPYMRIWVRHWYSDLYAIPATHFSLDPGHWRSLPKHLNDQLIFTSRPPGSAIPVGGKLVSVRHQSLETLQDLSRVRITDKRIWMRIRDPASTKRHVSVKSCRVLKLDACSDCVALLHSKDFPITSHSNLLA